MVIPNFSRRMSVLSILKHGAVLTGCGFVFFWLNRKFLGQIVPQKTRQNPLHEWRWINIANSFTHSFITGVGACYCMVKTPSVWQDLINGYSEVAYCLTGISAGYFLWDMIDMGMNNPRRSTYELLVHHVMVIACFGLALVTNRYLGYSVISLLLEVNSVFLHMRQLVLLSGGRRDGRFYRINGIINMATFVLFRIFGLGWLLIWTLRNRQLIGSIAFVLGTISMSGIMVMNFMLLAKVVRSDYFSSSRRRDVPLQDGSGSDSDGAATVDEDEDRARRRRRLSSRSDAISKSVQAVVAATEDVAHLAGLKDD